MKKEYLKTGMRVDSEFGIELKNTFKGIFNINNTVKQMNRLDKLEAGLKDALKEVEALKKEKKVKFEAATDKKVRDIFINEAKKKGYESGNYKCLRLPGHTFMGEIQDVDTRNTGELIEVIARTHEGCNVLFVDGKWATIIEATSI